MPPKSPPKNSIFQIKIELEGSDPPIWRRVLLPSFLTLNDLHLVIQKTMEWDNSHLWEFKKGKKTLYPIQDEEPVEWNWGTLLSMHVVELPQQEKKSVDAEEKDSEEEEVYLSDVLFRAGSKITYLYDFGDCWNHTILLEKTLPPDPKMRHPVCIAGELAAPPEDSGGLWGYAMKMEKWQNRENEDEEDGFGWFAEDFDPTRCDLEKINKKLKRITWE